MHRDAPKTRLLIASLFAIAAFSIPASAASQASPLTYYTTRAAVNAVKPGLPLQVFQPINFPAVIPAPLSSTTNNGDFVAGSILPGFALINENPSLSATGLYVDAGSVGCNWFGDPLVLTFSPGISAFGADSFASSGGSSWAGVMVAGIYNGTTLLAEPGLNETAGQTVFLGFTSTTPVTKIVITFLPSTDVSWAPHVENIAFGASNVWYVDGVHGNNLNDCKSSQTACKTIQHVISLVSPGDSITLAPATYTENLTINLSLNLNGAAAATTIIDGGSANRVISILSAGAVVGLTKVTVRNGVAAGGGGILNQGILTITNSILSGNVAASSYSATGGGIYNSGTLTITNSTVSGNSGATNFMYGGGIYNTGALTLNSSTLSGNSAGAFTGGGGGGIYTSGTVTINDSTLSANVASGNGGGGIYVSAGALSVNSSTLSRNSASGSGAVGGGIFNGGTATFQNSIVATSTSGGNCSGSVTSSGYNLSTDNTCAFTSTGDRNNTDPQLGALRNNGGPTRTQALPAGSPAVDAGNPAGCTDGQGNLLKTDQRGLPRPNKADASGCDMGAYELQKD